MGPLFRMQPTATTARAVTAAPPLPQPQAPPTLTLTEPSRDLARSTSRSLSHATLTAVYGIGAAFFITVVLSYYWMSRESENSFFSGAKAAPPSKAT